MKVPSTCADLVPKTPKALTDPLLVQAWDEFMTSYPSQQDCLIEIVRVLLDSGVISCRGCKAQNWEKETDRVYRCADCKTPRSVTAETFFHHMRSYRAWLAAIWLSERGITVSGLTFQKLLNIAYSTARDIQNRVMMAMHEPMREDKNSLLVSAAEFIELFRRRSFETKARQSPKSEESDIALSPEPSSRAIDEVKPDKPGSAREKRPKEQELLLDALKHAPLNATQLVIKTGLPISQISAGLSMLEVDGLCRRKPGNLYESTDQSGRAPGKSYVTPLDRAARQAVKGASAAIIETNNGISRKCLQLYLVAHWCCNARQRGASDTVFGACLKLGKKTSADIFSYVTPAMVRVACSKKAA